MTNVKLSDKWISNLQCLLSLMYNLHWFPQFIKMIIGQEIKITAFLIKKMGEKTSLIRANKETFYISSWKAVLSCYKYHFGFNFGTVS